MFVGPDEPRAHYQSLHEVLGTLSRDDFEERCAARDRAFRDQGITFQLSGEERPFPLDLVPRIIAADEWAVVEAGVRQRVLALEAFLADVYGPGEILADGVVPAPAGRRARRTSTARRRARARRRRARPRGRHRPRPRRRRPLPRARGQPAHAVGHLVRDREPAGDDARVPGAVRQPPRPPGRRLPDAAARSASGDRAARGRRSVRRRAHAGRPQRRVLRALVPRPPDGRRAGRGPRPRVPRQRVYMRTTAGEQRVDVVYRRIDDEYLDPLHFRPDSVLGCAGIVNAARAGQRDDRQRARQRRRRRQGDLPVRAGDDRVLPRRGADPRQRRDVPARGSPTCASGRSSGSTSSC